MQASTQIIAKMVAIHHAVAELMTVDAESAAPLLDLNITLVRAEQIEKMLEVVALDTDAKPFAFQALNAYGIARSFRDLHTMGGGTRDKKALLRAAIRTGSQLQDVVQGVMNVLPHTSVLPASHFWG